MDDYILKKLLPRSVLGEEQTSKSSHEEVFFRKGAQNSQDFSKLTENHLSQSLFLIKL